MCDVTPEIVDCGPSIQQTSKLGGQRQFAKAKRKLRSQPIAPSIRAVLSIIIFISLY
jgi:hypothetical protein